MNAAPSALDAFQYVGSFLLVIALLLALLWSLKKLQRQALFRPRPDARLQVVETLAIGPRQKIALLRLNDCEVLVGITAQQMTALAQWPAPIAAAPERAR